MTFSELNEIKNGDCLTTKYGDIVLIQRVDLTENGGAEVYYYFVWSVSEMRLEMNEWLNGFYGPAIEEDMFRVSTDAEKEFLFKKMAMRGYRWDSTFYGGGIPFITCEECNRIREIDAEGNEDMPSMEVVSPI